MRKFLLSLLFFVFACANAWGAVTPDITGKTVTFSGSGALSTSSSWRSSNSAITTVIIGDEVTSIAADAFNGMSNVTSVTIPSSVTSIGKNAFNGTAVSELFYKGSPSEWARISLTYKAAHPFCGSTKNGAARKFYFYGNTTSHTAKLVLLPTITAIKKLAFYHCEFDCINIPGTITSIGDSAFALAGSRSEYSAINCHTAPSLGTNSISSINFYIPSGAEGYTESPWKNHTSEKAISGTISDTYGAGITWDLDVNGVLTLNATTENKATSFSSSEQCPWYYLRRLIHKIVVKGDISSLTMLSWLWGISEIELNQTTIPTSTGISFGSLFNSRDDVVLKLGQASFADASVSNLGSAPWNNARLDIQLSGNVVLSDGADNSTLVSNLQTYFAGKTFTLQLGRSLTNTQYNTFCSPIDLTKAQLNNADIRALESSSLDGDVLTLTFSSSSLEGIEAGKPYLVKPSSAVANPTFENIDPSDLVSETENTETDFVDFIGVLAPTPLTGGNKNTLFLGAGNELFWPEADGNIGGMRAYFSVKGAAQKNGIKARIVMNKEVATDIESISDEGLPVTGKKILRNGQLFIIRDGKEYNVMGIMMK